MDDLLLFPARLLHALWLAFLDLILPPEIFRFICDPPATNTISIRSR